MTLRISTGSLCKAAALAALLPLTGCMSDPAIPRSAQSKAYHFNDMDGDGDDRLTLREIDDHLVLHRDFAHFDTDNNGWIGRGEFDAYLETMRDD